MIVIILGTRPEIIKLFPVINIFLKKKIPFKIIHTGQHYTFKLSNTFINQLSLPTKKIVNLNVGSGSHGNQTALMVNKIEKYLNENNKIKAVLLYGDTNSALAGSLAACKIQNIKIIHLEAGLRSFDKDMPEEVNRRIIDHSSDLLLCPTEISKKYLLNEGIPKKKIFVTGNTIVDAIKSPITQKFINAKDNFHGDYIVLTIHREENTKNINNLKKIINEMIKISKHKNYKIIFPTHPKTKKLLNKIKYDKNRLISTQPMDYFSFLSLLKNSKLAVSDSGGIQEEACILKVPLITIRNSTERPETIHIGCNILSKISDKMIYKDVLKILNKNIKWKNPYGNGNASQKSYKIIKQFLKKNDPKFY